MPYSTDFVTKPPWTRRLKPWLVPSMMLLMAVAIVLLITGNWNTWAGERAAQKNRRRLRPSGPHPPQHESGRAGGHSSGVPLSGAKPRGDARAVGGGRVRGAGSEPPGRSGPSASSPGECEG